MSRQVKKYTSPCNTCKYDRHPQKPNCRKLQYRAIQQKLSIDLSTINDEKFLTCVDKFSNFAKYFRIKNKTMKLIHYFTAPNVNISDNEESFISSIILNYIESMGISVYRILSKNWGQWFDWMSLFYVLCWK